MKTLATVALLFAASVLSAQLVVYDGSDFTKQFGSTTATGVHVPGVDSPGSTGGSADITFGGGFNTIAWNPIVPFSFDQVDWSTGDFSFDYKTTSVNMFRFRVFYFTGSSDTTILDLGGTVTALNTDGNWHTYTFSVSDWTQAFYDAGLDSVTDTLGSTELRFFFQNGGNTGTLSIDNITMPVVPEPSTYAAIFGLLGLGFAFWRRRRS